MLQTKKTLGFYTRTVNNGSLLPITSTKGEFTGFQASKPVKNQGDVFLGLWRLCLPPKGYHQSSSSLGSNKIRLGSNSGGRAFSVCVFPNSSGIFGDIKKGNQGAVWKMNIKKQDLQFKK